MVGPQLQTAFQGVGFFAVSVWILWAGQVVLIPVAFALITALLVSQVVSAFTRVPVLRHTPIWLRHVLVLMLFSVLLFLLVLQIRENVSRLLIGLPAYQTNIELVVRQVADRLGLDETPTWDRMLAFAADQVQPVAFVRRILAIFSGIGGQFALVVLYAVFLLVERGRFVQKLSLGFQDRKRAERMLESVREISGRTGAYLAAKTMVNVVLGVATYLALLALEIDLAAFWAIMAATLNYIPYFGSLVAVAIPVLMTLAQSGSLALTLATALVLTVIQNLVAFVLEPLLIGRSVNLILSSCCCRFRLDGSLGLRRCGLGDPADGDGGRRAGCTAPDSARRDHAVERWPGLKRAKG